MHIHVQVAEGTLGYAAPEQMQFHNGSPKSDVYSLGATIIYFATGDNPYGGMNHRGYILTQFTMGKPMPVSDSVQVCMRTWPTAPSTVPYSSTACTVGSVVFSTGFRVCCTHLWGIQT